MSNLPKYDFWSKNHQTQAISSPLSSSGYQIYKNPEEYVPDYDSGNFELESLGKGGFARVEKSYDIKENTYVALKFLLKKNEETLKIFKEEDALLSEIESLNEPLFSLKVSCHTLFKHEIKSFILQTSTCKSKVI